MLKVTRRELKLMLDHRMFVGPGPALEDLRADLAACAERAAAGLAGRFDATEERELVFLDTPHRTVLGNGFVLRRRSEGGKAEYTLKCRSADRYVAAAADVRGADGLEADEKMEEDIGAPYVPRFSHSNTVKGPDAAPATLAEAAELFPALGTLMHDGRRCPEEVALGPVGVIAPFERVHKGPVFSFGDKEAELALILWSRGRAGRLLVAELSFRYKDKHEEFSNTVAGTAMRLFEEIQRLDWHLPGGSTKTQFAYGSG